MSNLLQRLRKPNTRIGGKLLGYDVSPFEIKQPEQVNLGIPNEDFDKQVEQVRGEPEDLVMKAIEAMEDITDKESAQKRAKDLLSDKTIKETVKGLDSSFYNKLRIKKDKDK